MAYGMDWEARVLTVPQADLIYLSPNRYKLDLDEFRRKCRDLEADPSEGLSYPPIVSFNSAVDTGDVILGKVVLMINDYQLELEDTVERYSALFDGANTNLHNKALITNGIPTPNNSAGLQDLSTMLASAYQGQVVINVNAGQSGASTPIGTFKTPSNNIADALKIAISNGIKTLFFTDSAVITNEDLSANYRLVGASPLMTVAVEAAANLTGCSIETLTIIGELDGLNVVRSSAIGAVANANGVFEKCALQSTLEVNGDCIILECYSYVPGSGYPLVTVTSGDLAVRDYHGSIGLAGIASGNHSIGGSGGRVVIEASCTGGEIHIRGDWFEVVDNSGIGCAVYDERSDILEQDKADIADKTRVAILGAESYP